MMAKCLGLLVAFGLFICAAVALLALPAQQAALLMLFFLPLLVPLFRKASLSWQLGYTAFFLPLSALCGASAPFAFGCFALFLILCRTSVRMPNTFLPLVTLLLSSLLSAQVFEFSWTELRLLGQSARHFWHEAAFGKLWELSSSSFHDIFFRFEWHVVASSLVFLALLALTQHAPNLRLAFQRGTLAALPCIFLVLLSELFLPPAFQIREESPLWTSLGRYSASLSDPNAFGLYIFLSFTFLGIFCAQKSNRLIWLFPLLWCLSVLWSGSRAAFLGFLLLALVMLWRRSWRLGLTLSIMPILAVALLSIFPAVQQYLLSLGLPITLERLISHAGMKQWQQIFFSRSVFHELNLALFADHGFFGLGLGEYASQIFPYGKSLGMNMNEWTDNPNNFYFAIVLRYGVFGAVLWGYAFSNYRLRPGHFLSFASVCIFAFLLLLGPHLDFIEIAAITAVLLSEHLRQKESQQESGKASSRALLVLLVLTAGAMVLPFLRKPEVGVYPYERDQQRMYRWTGAEGEFDVRCGQTQGEQIVIPALPSLETQIQSLQVVFFWTDSEGREMHKEISGPGREALSFVCDTHDRKRQRVRFFVHSPWIPALRMPGSQDMRVLGVQIEE